MLAPTAEWLRWETRKRTNRVRVPSPKPTISDINYLSSGLKELYAFKMLLLILYGFCDIKVTLTSTENAYNQKLLHEPLAYSHKRPYGNTKRNTRLFS